MKKLRLYIMKKSMRFKEYFLFGEGIGKFIECPWCNKPIHVDVTKTTTFNINRCSIKKKKSE